MSDYPNAMWLKLVLTFSFIGAARTVLTGRCTDNPAVCCKGMNSQCNRGNCYCDEYCLVNSDCCPDFKAACSHGQNKITTPVFTLSKSSTVKPVQTTPSTTIITSQSKPFSSTHMSSTSFATIQNTSTTNLNISSPSASPVTHSLLTIITATPNPITKTETATNIQSTNKADYKDNSTYNSNVTKSLVIATPITHSTIKSEDTISTNITTETFTLATLGNTTVSGTSSSLQITPSTTTITSQSKPFSSPLMSSTSVTDIQNTSTASSYISNSSAPLVTHSGTVTYMQSTNKTGFKDNSTYNSHVTESLVITTPTIQNILKPESTISPHGAPNITTKTLTSATVSNTTISGTSSSLQTTPNTTTIKSQSKLFSSPLMSSTSVTHIQNTSTASSYTSSSSAPLVTHSGTVMQSTNKTGFKDNSTYNSYVTESLVITTPTTQNTLKPESTISPNGAPNITTETLNSATVSNTTISGTSSSLQTIPNTTTITSQSKPFSSPVMSSTSIVAMQNTSITSSNKSSSSAPAVTHSLLTIITKIPNPITKIETVSNIQSTNKAEFKDSFVNSSYTTESLVITTPITQSTIKSEGTISAPNITSETLTSATVGNATISGTSSSLQTKPSTTTITSQSKPFSSTHLSSTFIAAIQNTSITHSNISSSSTSLVTHSSLTIITATTNPITKTETVTNIKLDGTISTHGAPNKTETGTSATVRNTTISGISSSSLYNMSSVVAIAENTHNVTSSSWPSNTIFKTPDNSSVAIHMHSIPSLTTGGDIKTLNKKVITELVIQATDMVNSKSPLVTPIFASTSSNSTTLLDLSSDGSSRTSGFPSSSATRTTTQDLSISTRTPKNSDSMQANISSPNFSSSTVTSAATPQWFFTTAPRNVSKGGGSTVSTSMNPTDTRTLNASMYSITTFPNISTLYQTSTMTVSSFLDHSVSNSTKTGAIYKHSNETTTFANGSQYSNAVTIYSVFNTSMTSSYNSSNLFKLTHPSITSNFSGLLFNTTIPNMGSSFGTSLMPSVKSNFISLSGFLSSSAQQNSGSSTSTDISIRTTQGRTPSSLSKTAGKFALKTPKSVSSISTVPEFFFITSYTPPPNTNAPSIQQISVLSILGLAHATSRKTTRMILSNEPSIMTPGVKSLNIPSTSTLRSVSSALSSLKPNQDTEEEATFSHEPVSVTDMNKSPDLPTSDNVLTSSIQESHTKPIISVETASIISPLISHKTTNLTPVKIFSNIANISSAFEAETRTSPTATTSNLHHSGESSLLTLSMEVHSNITTILKPSNGSKKYSKTGSGNTVSPKTVSSSDFSPTLLTINSSSLTLNTTKSYTFPYKDNEFSSTDVSSLSSNTPDITGFNSIEISKGLDSLAAASMATTPELPSTLAFKPGKAAVSTTLNQILSQVTKQNASSGNAEASNTLPPRNTEEIPRKVENGTAVELSPGKDCNGHKNLVSRQSPHQPSIILLILISGGSISSQMSFINSTMVICQTAKTSKNQYSTIIIKKKNKKKKKKKKKVTFGF